MHKETKIAHVKHDFAWSDLGKVGALNRNKVTWKDRGYHTCAEYAETNHSERADNLPCQATRQCRRLVLRSAHKVLDNLLRRPTVTQLKNWKNCGASANSARRRSATHGTSTCATQFTSVLWGHSAAAIHRNVRKRGSPMRRSYAW